MWLWLVAVCVCVVSVTFALPGPVLVPVSEHCACACARALCVSDLACRCPQLAKVVGAAALHKHMEMATERLCMLLENLTASQQVDEEEEDEEDDDDHDEASWLRARGAKTKCKRNGVFARDLKATPKQPA